MADIPLQPEQDAAGGGGLPTYEDLAQQNGPNSRFGRWRGWVEKRAAERYADITSEERLRRRARGWGNGVDQQNVEDESTPSILSRDSDFSESTLQALPFEPPSYNIPEPSESPTSPSSLLSSSIPTPGEPVPASHLRLFNFGSRFLPHTSSQIRCLLPILGDRLLLIGHDEGLSVLNIFPSGDAPDVSFADAKVKPIWEGEGVYQLEILESQNAEDYTPSGVVLALVGSEPQSPNAKDQEMSRSIRMYNLASLISLARWAVTQTDAAPVDLRRSLNWSPRQSKKHKHSSSISRLTKPRSGSDNKEPQSSYPSSTSSPTKLRRGESSLSVDSTWDVVEDLPFRWATDYVPLASPGSRLLNSTVLFFELKKREDSVAYKGVSVLAIATKASIFLYETPRGERAFRFAKEFYTPLQPKGISFVQQRVLDTVVLRSISNSSQSSRMSDQEPRRFSIRPQQLEVQHERARSVSPTPDYGNQPSLFVVFEKKAGLIRLADSAVGEVELFDDTSSSISVASSSSTSPRRHKPSFEPLGSSKDLKGCWLKPSLEQLPVAIPDDDGWPSSSSPTQSVYLLTRGQQTHIMPFPLPAPLSSSPPLSIITWLSKPNHVCHRVCRPPDGDEPPFLQVVSMGELGVEVQELPLPLSAKGKGRGRGPSRGQLDVGGDAGYLLRSGLWHKRAQAMLSRQESFMSTDSVSTVQPDRRHPEFGFYGWSRRGLNDWRVFWLGGMEKGDESMDLL